MRGANYRNRLDRAYVLITKNAIIIAKMIEIGKTWKNLSSFLVFYSGNIEFFSCDLCL